MKRTFFDAHTDTILKVFANKTSLLDNKFHVSLKKLSEYKSPIITMAVFNEGDFLTEDIIYHIKFMEEECLKNHDIAHFAKDYIDHDKINIIPSIEGLGNTKDITADHIQIFKDMGVRMISITWNQDNPLCGGIGENSKGVSPLGKDILKKMEENHIILDVSHISDKGFYDAMEIFGGRVCASHSNSRTICSNPRNVSDQQFNHIASRNGVCGINLYPIFLNSSKNATIDDAIRHIEHFMSLGGDTHIGLGTDFDGIDCTPSEIPDCSAVYKLFNTLSKLNYPDETINKIAYKNFCNLLNF